MQQSSRARLRVAVVLDYVKAAVLSFAYHANLVPENVRKAAYSFCSFCRS